MVCLHLERPRLRPMELGSMVMCRTVHTAIRPRQWPMSLGSVPNSIGLCLGFGSISENILSRSVYTFRHHHHHCQKFIIVLMVMSSLTGRLGNIHILPIKVSVTTDTMFNFDGDGHSDGDGVGKCK